MRNLLLAFGLVSFVAEPGLGLADQNSRQGLPPIMRPVLDKSDAPPIAMVHSNVEVSSLEIRCAPRPEPGTALCKLIQTMVTKRTDVEVEREVVKMANTYTANYFKRMCGDLGRTNWDGGIGPEEESNKFLRLFRDLAASCPKGLPAFREAMAQWVRVEESACKVRTMFSEGVFHRQDKNTWTRSSTVPCGTLVQSIWRKETGKYSPWNYRQHRIFLPNTDSVVCSTAAKSPIMEFTDESRTWDLGCRHIEIVP